MKIIVGAVISLPPFSPGMAWNWMHHVLGLRDLGHEVWYVEELEPEWWTDAAGRPCRPEASVNRALFERTIRRFGLAGRAVQLSTTGEAVGLPAEALAELAGDADLLINMSGHVRSELILGRVKRRVYVDQDPVYTQLWHAEYGHTSHLEAHDAFFSVGLNVGTEHSHVPDCGITWHHVLPPVVLDHWAVSRGEPLGAFTTIASWSGYRDLSYRGEWYRSKHPEFTRLADLPRLTGRPFEVALKAYREDDPDIGRLRKGGWRLAGAGRIAGLDAYQRYIARSRAEIGVAKGAYVTGRSGWFSDRSAHYLASGRPVLAQSTGFERCLPTGRGLLTFATLEEAASAVAEIDRDYESHCAAARKLAEDHLDHRKVLPPMLERCVAETGRERAGSAA